MLYGLAVFAPLAGALVSGLLGKAIGDKGAMGASVFGMVVAAICGPLAFFQLTGGRRTRRARPRHLDRSRAASMSNGRCVTTPCPPPWLAMVTFVADADPRLFHRLHGARGPPEDTASLPTSRCSPSPC